MAIRVGSKGRIVLPLAAREALGVAEDDELIAIVKPNEVLLLTKDEAIRRIRKPLRRESSVVEELIAEHRAEARREDGE